MRYLFALPLIVALSACNRPAAEATADQATAPARAFDSNCAFCANPAFVKKCEVAGGVRTTLYWNVGDNIHNVGIYVVDDAGKDSPFSDQPAKGSIQTGPWLKPGLTFKLKDPSGKVLQTLVIVGKDC